LYKYIIFDERQMGESLYLKGYSEHYTFTETLLVSKYLKNEMGLDGRSLKNALREYVQKFDPMFASHSRLTMLKTITKKSSVGYISTGEVLITKKEIDAIREIKNFKFQKIALSILLISKRKTNNGTINIRSFREVKYILGNKITRNDILHCIFAMKSMGMIDVHDVHKLSGDVDVWYTVTFVDNDNKNVILNIDTDATARRLGKLYEEFCGGVLGYCSCGNEFIRTNNYQRMCPSCSAKRKHRRVRPIMNVGLAEEH